MSNLYFIHLLVRNGGLPPLFLLAACCSPRLWACDSIHLLRDALAQPAFVEIKVVASFYELNLRVTIQRLERVAQDINCLLEMKRVGSADDDVQLAAQFRP